MLQSDYLSVMEVEGRDGFLRELTRFTHKLGFETVGAFLVVDRLQGDPDFISIDNAPDGYEEISADREYGKRSPVTQHCKVSSVPLIWDQGTYVRANQGADWERQACFGYRCGIALAMHLPRGLHFAIGVDRDMALPACTAEVTRMTAALQLLVVHAQDAALRILLPQPREDDDTPRLTARELECLRWTMEGKTAWELGRILGIAEQTVARHVHNASQKLQCVNKHQAVLKALRLKLIW